MGPNSISRDRSNDSNNGHNSEDDTNLSGVEEMEESITGKIFFVKSGNVLLWALGRQRDKSKKKKSLIYRRRWKTNQDWEEEENKNRL